MHYYSPKHSTPFTPSAARIRGRIIGLSVAGVATIATGLATSSSAQASGGSVWDRVAACESGGNWSINTGNGFYGGLQFTHSTWIGYGGGRYASNANGASRSAQIAIAQRVLAGQGPGAWPVCSRRAGLTRSNGGASSGASAPAPRKVVHKSVHKAATHPAPAKRVSAPAPKRVVHSARATVRKPVNAAPALTPMRGVVDSGKTLTVRRGDCLSKLAATYNVKGGWRALWSLNQAKVADPNLVFVGQSLRIPK